jgi:superfamily I DNA/RNA helicase
MATTKKLSLTKEQVAIKDFVNNNNDNLVVVARAGTGKSSTIEAVAPKHSHILCFNKAPADEMSARLPATRTASTFHKFGKDMMPKNTTMDNWYISKLIDNIVFAGNRPTKPEQYTLKTHIDKGVSWLKTNAVLPDTSDSEVLKILLDERLDAELPAEQYAHHCLEVLQACIEPQKNRWGKTTQLMNFDDMQWKPYVLGLGKGCVPNLFIDEAQDLNPIRMKLATQWGERLIAVGDDYQAIYAWNGSMSDSLSLFQETTGATGLPLSVCWRCPHSHLDMARSIVSDIKDRPNAPEGIIEELGDFNPTTFQDEGVLVVCRTNAPLIKHYLRLRKELDQQVVFYASNNIIEALKSLVGWKKADIINMVWIDQFEARYEKKVRYLKSPMAKSVYADYKAVIDEIIVQRNPRSVEELHNIFDDEFTKPETKDIVPNAIRLSSIHSAKGLEHNNVVFYGISNVPHPLAKLDWELKQEANLKYVALTRSKNYMGIISSYE